MHFCLTQARQEDVHIAAEDGKVDDVAAMLDKGEEGMRLSISKDAAGLGLLHKAVLRGFVPLAEMLVEKYPQTVHLRDHVSFLRFFVTAL